MANERMVLTKIDDNSGMFAYHPGEEDNYCFVMTGVGVDKRYYDEDGNLLGDDAAPEDVALTKALIGGYVEFCTGVQELSRDKVAANKVGLRGAGVDLDHVYKDTQAVTLEPNIDDIIIDVDYLPVFE